MAVSSYTCNTCGLAFETAEGQRFHMKSDWHRYNLKRRVAQLPSISLDVFNEKVAIMSVNSNSNSIEEEEEKQTVNKHRTVTKKELKRQKKEEIMKQRRELLEKAKMELLKQASTETITASEEQPEEEEIEKEIKKQVKEEDNKDSVNSLTETELADKLLATKLNNQVKIPPTTCLFCRNRSFNDIATNMAHMFKNHGLFIPEQKYLVDVNGLLEYLGEKVGLGNVCLCCNYQGRDLQAVRAHMLSKGHCRLPYDNEEEKLEISEFFDFSSTYEGAKSKRNIVVEEGEDEAWEDVSGEEEEEDDGDDEDLERDVLYNDGVELYLPTGIKVGHRALQRYFKQDLKPERVLSEGQGTVIAAETRHLVSVVDKKAMEVQKRIWKTEVYNKKRDDKRAAKFINNQPHFRDPLLQ